MALTPQQIYEIINETASLLGFDFVASDDNLESIPLTQPEQVNLFISAINPIIHDKIMDSFDKRGYMKRFINTQKGGSTTRHISFGVSNDARIAPTQNSLQSLVGNYSVNPSVNVSSINVTISPCATIDRRELSKVFTVRSLVDYIINVERNLRDIILNTIRIKLFEVLFTTDAKYFDNLSIGNPSDATPYAIKYHQGVYSGEILRLSNNPNVNDFINNITLSDIPNRSLTNFDYIFFDTPDDDYWYTNLHFHPEGLERYVIPSYEGHTKSFVLPVDSIQIEEYNRYVEMQEIPNSPGRYNIFFNSDMAISINFNYSILRINYPGNEPTA